MSDFKTNVVKLSMMMRLQDEANLSDFADWRERRLPWYRAIWTSCAQLLEDIGWDWRERSTSNKSEQVKLGMVEIWRSELSLIIQNMQPAQYDEQAIQIGAPLFDPTTGGQIDIRIALESLAEQTLSDKHFHIQRFARVMALAEMSFDELHRIYVCEAVLRKFRRQNGRKKMGIRKDRDVMNEIIRSMNADSSELPELLYTALACACTDD